MPPLETMDLKQRAVVWPLVGTDRYGEPTVSDTPREVPVRWTWTRREMTDPQGNTIVVDAQAVVNEDIKVGSLMWLSTLDDLPAGTGWSLSEFDEELMRVVTTSKGTDLKNRFTRRTLGLSRFRDTLPSQESEA